MKKLLIFSAFLFFVFGIASPVFAAKQFQVDTGGTLTTNLKAYYKLEDVNDFYDNAYNLTNTNTATFAAGKINNAVNLVRASTQYLSIANNLGIDGGAISISGWFKIAALPSDPPFVFATQSNATSKVRYQLDYIYSGGIYTMRAIRLPVGGTIKLATYNVTLSTSTWYNFTLWYDGTNLKLFEGATERATVAAADNGVTAAPNIFTLGVDSDISVGTYHDGLEDEVGVWSKALSSTELTDLNNSGSGQTMTDVVATAKRRPPMIIQPQ